MTNENNTVYLMRWLESERGWGQQHFGYSLHLNKEDCKSYIEKYWSMMPDAVPEWYVAPCGGGKNITVPETVYKKVADSKHGLAMSGDTLEDVVERINEGKGFSFRKWAGADSESESATIDNVARYNCSDGWTSVDFSYDGWESGGSEGWFRR